MAMTFRTTLILCISVSFSLSCSAQTCSNHTFSTNKAFKSCIDLPYLQAHLHWNYDTSSKQAEIAYRSYQTPTGWIAWAINPSGAGMVGSQALVAFQHSNGSMIAYPTPITSYSPSMQPGALSFPVHNISAEYAKYEMTIFAVVGPLDNTIVSHVWQSGGSVSNNVPQMHAASGANVQSMGTLNFQEG